MVVLCSCLYKNFKLYGYLSERYLFVQSTLLMNAMYIVLAQGDLYIYRKIIAYAINFYEFEKSCAPRI